MMGKQYTARGFRNFLEMADSRDHNIRVRQSSEVGGPYCWIFVGKLGSENEDAYLSVDQAEQLANALLAFVQEARDGTLP